MSTRILHISFNLLFSSLFLTCSWTASGAMLELEKDTKDTRAIFETLFQSTEYAASPRSGKRTITSPADAKLTITLLKQGLRENGDIGAIAVLSPQIIKLIPEDQTIRYLFAIALAAQGNPSTASNQTAELQPDEQNSLYALLSKAAIAKAQGQFDAAADIAQQAIHLDSDHPYAYNLLGQIRMALGDSEAAADQFRTAIEKAPRFVAAHSNLGAVSFLLGDYTEAWQSLTKSIELSPGFCPALMGRAALSIELGNTAKAIEDLSACLHSNPDQLQARKRLISLYLQQGQLDKAMEQANSAQKQDPIFTRMTLAEIYLRRNQPIAAREQLQGITEPSAQTKYLLSYCDILEGNPESAIDTIQQAEKLQPESSTLKLSHQIFAFYAGKLPGKKEFTPFFQKPGVGSLAAFVAGSVFVVNDNYIDAYRVWSQARDLVPGFILSGLSPDQIQQASTKTEQRYLSMGVLFYLKGYYMAALAEFGKALQANADSFLGNFFYALTLNQTGGSDTANKYLLRSIKLTPGFFPANYMLAESYLKHGDKAKAIEHYAVAARSEPDQGVLVKLGLLYESQGKVDEAAKIYQTFIHNHPNSFLGYNQLAWLYAKQGINLDKANKLALKADDLRPNNSSVNDTLGWIHFLQQQYNEADRFLQKAKLISRGKNPDILFHLAALEHKKGNTKSAKELLEQALKISDSFESVNDAKRLLSKIEASGS